MEEQKTRMIKITMPYKYADEFVTEAKLSFADSRWLLVMFKSRMYDALLSLISNSDRKHIEEVKDELKQYIKEMYITMEMNRK